MADSLDGNYILEGEADDFARSSSSKLRSEKPGQDTQRKRARDDEDDSSGADDDDSNAMRAAAGASSEDKKRKRKQRQKARKARLAVVRQEEEDARVNPAAIPPAFQADWLRKELRKCKACRDLSEIEMDEIAVPERLLVDSTSWQQSRDEGDLSPFIKKLLPQVSSDEAPRNSKGSPTILVLTNNALRASHLARELRGILPPGSQTVDKQQPNKTHKMNEKKIAAEKDASKQPDSEAAKPILQIAKLFSRHFSAKEQTDFLNSHHVLGGAGTSQRIASLIQKGALKLDDLKAIVLDAGWRDDKMRGLMDEEGGREGVKEVWDAVRKEKPEAQILLF
ncbi:unnamed protein product [Sympodiomycopsis kandeliae]